MGAKPIASSPIEYSEPCFRVFYYSRTLAFSRTFPSVDVATGGRRRSLEGVIEGVIEDVLFSSPFNLWDLALLRPSVRVDFKRQSSELEVEDVCAMPPLPTVFPPSSHWLSTGYVECFPGNRPIPPPLDLQPGSDVLLARAAYDQGPVTIESRRGRAGHL